jgi:hypothetical protein
MEDVNISKFRAQVVRSGSTPASPGFVVSEGQNPVDPSGSGQNHLPVTIATASTGLSITESQVLGGAGTVGQYIRGDGSLADFPATTGGGSSVSYYLNGSVSQGTIGGVAYKELNRTPVFGAGTDITISANGYIASFITDALDPNKLLIPAGNWNFETYFSANSGGGSPSFYIELYKYNGTTFTLIATSSATPELIAFGTSLNPYYSTLAVPETVLALTDRLALRYYVTHSGRTITLHTENGHLCQVITTFTTGLTALNGLTNQVQFFAVGTSGTDFAISSASDTHTFNLPTASATNRGALSSADWTTFNNKTSNLGTVTSVGLSSATSGVTIGSTPITTSGTITLAIATASGSQNGLLSSTDWTTFNSKQNALTNPVTGTGTTNYLPKFTGSTTIGNSNLINDASGNVGLGVTPSAWVSAFKAIQILNQASISAEADLIAISVNAFYDTSWKYIANGVATNYYQNNGNHVWRNSISGTAGNAIIFTQAMTLTAAGRLLINTPTESTFQLDVNGTFRANSGEFLNGGQEGSLGSVVRISTTNTNSSSRNWAIVNTWDNYGDLTFRVSNSQGGNALSAGSSKMVILSNGNVGIGTTSPAAEFQVNKSSDVGIAMSNSSSVTSGPRGSLLWYNSSVSTVALIRAAAVTDNVGTELQFYTRPAAGSLTQRMTITSDGNVQVFSAGQLQVFRSDNARSGLFYCNNLAAIVEASTDPLRMSTPDRLEFYAGSTERMRITSDGTIVLGNVSASAIGYFTYGGGFANQTTLDANTRFQGPNNAATAAKCYAWNTYSDQRVKKEVLPISYGLKEILKLKPVSYHQHDSEVIENQIILKDNYKKTIGLIAQEVNELINEAVTIGNEKELWGLDYDKIIPVIIKSIQELNEKIK